jgi:hypothetical protein
MSRYTLRFFFYVVTIFIYLLQGGRGKIVAPFFVPPAAVRVQVCCVSILLCLYLSSVVNFFSGLETVHIIIPLL